MNAGRLNKLVTVLKPVDTDDGQGGRIRSYKAYKDIWLAFKKPSVRDVIATGTPATELMYEVVARYIDSHDIKRGYQYQADDTTYEVVHAFTTNQIEKTFIIKELVM